MLSLLYKKYLLPTLLLIVGLYLFPIQIFEKDFSKVPGDMGDARFNNYILEHDYKYFTGQVDSYWDAPFMYPQKNVIAFSDNLLGTAPIYSIYRLVGADRETAFQLWLLTLFALNFICCYWALNKWFNNKLLAATGAYIFAFSIFIVGMLNHVQNFPRFIVPFVFYWCWKYLSEKQIKYFLFLMLGIVFQFYCGIYLGFFLVYTVLFLFISYILVYRDWTLFQQFKKIKITSAHLLIIILTGILLAPLMLPYIELSQKLGMREFNDTINSIPTLRSYFFSSTTSVMWGSLSTHGMPILNEWWNHCLFIGALPWIVIALIPIILFSKTTASNEKKFLVFIFIALFLSFIFSLRIDDFTLYRIIFELPGFSAMRAINRVLNTEIVFFIIILVLVFNELSKKNKRMKWIIMSLPLLVVIDNLINTSEVPNYDKSDSQKEIKNLKEHLEKKYDRKHSAAALIFDEYAGNKIELNISSMLASQELNIPCVNGYTGSCPSEYSNFGWKTNEESLDEWLHFNKTNKNSIQIIDETYQNIKEKKKIYIKGVNNKFLCADSGETKPILANREESGLWETFTILIYENNTCAILSYKKYFLCPELNYKNEITANRLAKGDWETFELIKVHDNLVAFKATNGKYWSVNNNTSQIFANKDSITQSEIFELIQK